MRIIKAVLAFLAAIAAVFGVALALWIEAQDPERLIAGPPPDYRVAEIRRYEKTVAAGRREYVAVRLEGREGDVASFVVSLPTKRRNGTRLPVLIVLSGLRSGEKTLDRIAWHGTNAIVSYDYPLDLAEWRSASLLARAGIAYRIARRIPDQIAAVTRWVRSRPWADSDRLAYAGISLGAVVLPAALRRTQKLGLGPRPAVLAYGGVDIATLAYANFRKIEPPALRRLAALGAGLLLRALEPARHLPYLKGEFLLINGSEDERIPRASARRLHALTPEPKTVLTLPGLHIDPRRPELIARTVAPARDWLVRRGALNP